MNIATYGNIAKADLAFDPYSVDRISNNGKLIPFLINNLGVFVSNFSSQHFFNDRYLL